MSTIKINIDEDSKSNSDLFYSQSNQKALAKSIEELKNGKIVVKTIDELKTMH